MESVRPDITVVIPSFNSAAFLEKTCQKTAEVLSRSFNWKIIIVDDCSTDATWEVIKKLHSRDAKIKGISLKENRGQQEAVFCGLLFSDSDWTVTMDDDLEHDPEAIPLLYEKADAGYDLVYADAPRAYSLVRKAGSFFHDILFFLLFKKPPGIKITSFRIISKNLLAEIIKTDRQFIYVSALFLLCSPSVGVLKTGKRLKAQEECGHRSKCRSRYNLKKLIILFYKLLVNYSFRRTPAAGSSGKRIEISDKIKERLL